MSHAIQGRAVSVSASLSLFAVLLWGVSLVRPMLPVWIDVEPEHPPITAFTPPTTVPPPQQPKPVERQRTQDQEPITVTTTPSAPALSTTPATLPEIISPLNPMITNPTWIRRPTEQELIDFYPESAFFRGIEGQVQLDCLVSANGRLSCTVIEETPTGKGFGRAALDAARLFKIAPQLKDGRASEGGRISIPINFHMPRD
jgi:periplasmic protein TonB